MGNVEVVDPARPVPTDGWKVDVSRGEWNGGVSSKWFNRPDDERYLSLGDLWASVKGRSECSRSRMVQTADIRVEATRDSAERLHLVLPKGQKPAVPTHSGPDRNRTGAGPNRQNMTAALIDSRDFYRRSYQRLAGPSVVYRPGIPTRQHDPHVQKVAGPPQTRSKKW